MKRLFIVSACVAALFFAGCSRQPKEVTPAAKAEAASLLSEAQFAMQIREFPRAEELIDRALKLRDDVPEYWVSLGMARRRQDNKSGARKAYEQALEMHSDLYKKDKAPEQLVQQSFVLALLGKNDDALKLLQKGLKDHPDSAVIKKMADPRGLPRTFQSADFKALAL
jgi:tetratricopeptide (TPR) repeat protein